MRRGAILPEYQTAGAAGFDFHACLEEAVVLPPKGAANIPVGIGVELPKGYELQIRARSGLAFKNRIGLVNGVGTIDPDFRGEMYVFLINHGDKDFIVEPGMRIAQGVISKFETAEWEEVDELSETARKGGLGSTGLE